jgi:hypothetical protein
MRVINFGEFMEGKFSYVVYNKSQFSDDLSKVEISIIWILINSIWPLSFGGL